MPPKKNGPGFFSYKSHITYRQFVMDSLTLKNFSKVWTQQSRLLLASWTESDRNLISGY